jgi:hypothetical protein
VEDVSYVLVIVKYTRLAVDIFDEQVGATEGHTLLSSG